MITYTPIINKCSRCGKKSEDCDGLCADCEKFYRPEWDGLPAKKEKSSYVPFIQDKWTKNWYPLEDSDIIHRELDEDSQ